MNKSAVKEIICMIMATLVGFALLGIAIYGYVKDLPNWGWWLCGAAFSFFCCLVIGDDSAVVTCEEEDTE